MSQANQPRPVEVVRLNVGSDDRRLIRVLCVEDNDGDFFLLKAHLSDAVFDFSLELHRAVLLSKALELLTTQSTSESIHVVLLDLSLPDSHGLDTFHEIRRATPGSAIIVLSGNSDQDLALRMVKLGAQDYLTKDTLSGDTIVRSIIYSCERQRLRIDLQKLNERLVAAQSDIVTMQSQLIQAEKLDSLGRIAASVAHEVKNPLATLQMGVDYFQNHRTLVGETGSMMVDFMQESIERAVRIIHEMLDFSRSEQLALKPIPVNEVAASALRMIASELLERRANVVPQFEPSNPIIRVDRSKLEQVLINLLMNAAQAMPEGGDLHVKTSQGIMGEFARDEGHREMDLVKPGDSIVIIEVRDHGSGISNSNLDRIFEPFFTTKPTGQGTGLGLPVCKRIIDLHRGLLQIVNADPPPGARARIILKSDV